MINKKNVLVKEGIAIKLKAEMAKENSPLKKIPLAMIPDLVLIAAAKVAKAKSEGKVIQPLSTPISVTKTKETILTPAEARRKRTSPLIIATTDDNTTIQNHIKEKAKQIAQGCSLQKLQDRLTGMASSEEKNVFVPVSTAQLPQNIKSLNAIVKGLSVSGISKTTPTKLAYIINLALDVGFAYCHKVWTPHAAAAKTGNSLGAPEKDDSQHWAIRVEACYVEELKKGLLHKTALTNAYWTVTKEFFAGKNKTAKQMRDCKLNPKLRRWWHCHYPERKNEQ